MFFRNSSDSESSIEEAYDIEDKGNLPQEETHFKRHRDFEDHSESSEDSDK